jgi:hypothetical protein
VPAADGLPGSCGGAALASADAIVAGPNNRQMENAVDQQHASDPTRGHPDTHAGDAGLPEVRDAPAATVLAEGEWLAVSTEGFSEQQRGRPLEHLVKELVQNAMDSVGGSGRIDLDIQPAGLRRATIRCADDGPGADDLSRLNVVFVTGKKDGVTQRGRMGRGFKELLSVATHATVRSRGQELCFTVGGDDVRRVTHRRGLHPHPGFAVVMQIEHDEAGKDLSSYFRSFLLPPGVVLAVNGVPVPPRPVHKTVEARLTTERFAHGRWEKPVLATRIHLVTTAEGEQPLIHEMGIPVCDAEWSEPFHVDVCQRVPMNPNRDAVQAGYPARLHKACLPALLPEMTTERVLASWVGEAAQSAGDAVQKAVVAKAFGAGAVRAVPATGRFDHNADAEELGSTVVHSAHMTGGFRKLLQQQVPTAAAVAKEAMRRRAETAVEAGLGRAEVAALDLAADGADATKAIARFGREAVLARMDFAQWFAEAVVECRYGQPRAVPVQVAHLEHYAATWSLGGTLTLSLAHEPFWDGPFGRCSFELLLHELAHHEAFHHGRSFPKEVEAYAGAAAEVMLARADEARRLFPELLPGNPGPEPAASSGPVLDDPGHDGTGEEDRPRPSWMQRLRLRMQGQRLVADSRKAAEDAHG